MEQGTEALLIIGLNDVEQRLTLRRPVGSWRLKLQGNQPEFGGSGPCPFPPSFDVHGSGLTMVLPPFSVAVYFSVKP
jgi:hypothetical protein